MKRFSLIALLSILCVNAAQAANYDMQLQMLDNEINKLSQERQTKMKALEDCASKVKGFKIAGIATLALTGVGIGVNIAQANTKSNLDKKIDAERDRIHKEEQARREAEIRAQQQQLLLTQQQILFNNPTTGTVISNGATATIAAVAEQPMKVAYLSNSAPTSNSASKATATPSAGAGAKSCTATVCSETEITIEIQRAQQKKSAAETKVAQAKKEIDTARKTVEEKQQEIAAAPTAAAKQEKQREADNAERTIAAKEKELVIAQDTVRAAETEERKLIAIAPIAIPAIQPLAVPAVAALPENIAVKELTDKEKKKVLETMAKNEANSLKTLRNAELDELKSAHKNLKENLGEVKSAKNEMSGTIRDIERKQMDDLLKRHYPDLMGAQELTSEEKYELGLLLLQARQDQAKYGAALDGKVAQLKAKIADNKAEQKQVNREYNYEIALADVNKDLAGTKIAVSNAMNFSLPTNPSESDFNRGLDLVKKAEREIDIRQAEIDQSTSRGVNGWPEKDKIYINVKLHEVNMAKVSVAEKRAELESARRTFNEQSARDKANQAGKNREDRVNNALGL